MSEHESKPGFGVAASPFNPIKLELVLFIIGAFIVSMFLGPVLKLTQWELPLLLLYCGFGFIWIISRTCRILQQLKNQHGPG